MKRDAPYPPAYAALDVWRGLASLAVVAFHAGQVVIDGRLAGRSPDPWLRLTELGYLGVPVFFVISGYCIAAAAVSGARRPAGGAGRFLLARGRRIYPTYWAAAAMTVATVALAARLSAAGVLHGSHSAAMAVPHDWRYWAANVALAQPEAGTGSVLAVSWTLCYELAFYAALAAALAAARWAARPALVLHLSHALTAACLVALVAGVRLRFPLDLWPAFGFGVVCYDRLTRPRDGRATAVAAGLLAMGLAVPAVRAGTVGLLAEPVRLVYPVAVAFAVLLLALRRWDGPLGRSPLARPLGWVGLVSYSLYLTHFAVLGFVNQAAKRYPGTASGPRAQLAASTAAAVAFAVPFWFAFERPLRPRHRRPTNEQPAELGPLTLPAAT